MFIHSIIDITDDPALDAKLEKLNQFTQELEKQLSKEEEKEVLCSLLIRLKTLFSHII